MIRPASDRLRDRLSGRSDLVMIYSVLVVVVALGLVLSPDFRQPQNAVNVLRQAVALGIVAVGQTVVILAGGIDLSVGATISLIAVYASGLMNGQPGFDVVVPIVLLMAGASLLVGAVNALIINHLRVPPFITTLGTGSIIQGLILLYTKTPKGRQSPDWQFFAQGMIGPVPVPVVYFLLLAVITWLMLNRTVLGRYIFATGGSETVARQSGIQTRRVILFAYMFCSLTAALSGLFLVSRMGIGDPQVGGLSYDRFDLDSITAVLIGGTRLGGGKGYLTGTVAGVLILSVLNNIFNLIGVSSYYQWVIKGLIVLFAVGAYANWRRGTSSQ